MKLNLLLFQTDFKCHHACLKVCTAAGSSSVSWCCALSYLLQCRRGQGQFLQQCLPVYNIKYNKKEIDKKRN